MSTTGSLGTVTEDNIVVLSARYSCNGLYTESQSGGFVGSSLQLSISFTPVSGTCVSQEGPFTYTITLNKQ
jgi:hypothetical protein